MAPAVVVTSALAEATARSADPARREWLAELPQRVADLAEQWRLEVGDPFEPGGTVSWVAPARDADGRDVVLKVAWTHDEGRDEAAGLAVWAGRGAVAVHTCSMDGRTTAMLLERCRPGVELRTRPVDEQHRVVGDLVRQLHTAALPAGHGFRTLAQMCEAWGEQARAGHERAPGVLDPALVREGLVLWDELPTTSREQVLLCTDLHAGNVLSGRRSPWLLIDPKPHVGDPHYDVVQHFLNCERELHTDPLVRAVAGVTDLDEERLVRWLFARCVQECWRWPVLAPVARTLSSAALG
ncbi:kinase [Streptomyces sp. NP160]|uniref:aminoglycoside phosphotransferase family protein n=1 Tax=Streptomyces sp. NP160 TaxID=2586637 RepID=UPI001119A708|nr:aminoglycoside phosphotransferase family protein [Streptomyces sp. NP160]TNM67266.1 kinase [Streptomyces sp. NP160]